MKLFISSIFYLLTNSTFASEYFECKSPHGSTATLSLQGRSLQWNDISHSASSRGVYLGVDNSPYSKERGYHTFDLVDFYRTNDSRFYIKVEPNFDRKKLFSIIEGFDHDGHEEGEERFFCRSI